jgi:hypothetical protein
VAVFPRNKHICGRRPNCCFSEIQYIVTTEINSLIIWVQVRMTDRNSSFTEKLARMTFCNYSTSAQTDTMAVTNQGILKPHIMRLHEGPFKKGQKDG